MGTLAFIELVSMHFQIMSYKTFRAHTNHFGPFVILIHPTNWSNRIEKGRKDTIDPFAWMKIKLCDGSQGINHIYLCDIDSRDIGIGTVNKMNVFSPCWIDRQSVCGLPLEEH